jgi:hypothetical protein
MTQERINEPTPNGGVYAIAYFYSDKRKPTAKAKATHVEIVEFDANDKEIWRTYGELEK